MEPKVCRRLYDKGAQSRRGRAPPHDSVREPARCLGASLGDVGWERLLHGRRRLAPRQGSSPGGRAARVVSYARWAGSTRVSRPMEQGGERSVGASRTSPPVRGRTTPCDPAMSRGASRGDGEAGGLRTHVAGRRRRVARCGATPRPEPEEPAGCHSDVHGLGGAVQLGPGGSPRGTRWDKLDRMRSRCARIGARYRSGVVRLGRRARSCRCVVVLGQEVRAVGSKCRAGCRSRRARAAAMSAPSAR